MSDQDMNTAVKNFLASPRFAVAGASSDPSKFGHRVFAWYLQRSLPVTPLNPSRPSVSVSSKDYDTVSSPSALQQPKETGLSVITPPAVTKKLLQEAKEAGVRAVWLQPGSFNDDILEYAKKEFPGAAVGGDGGRGGEGWCVLVDGDSGLRAAGREQGRL
ncbi:NAD(P)-binding protein [Aureobasidium sp. EXF-3400]|nr:NAD(P)-binding protein [Aureobasidium sp. EXF-12344]KAI4769032.1 NAD(P)-binding protein [Aureobasidium sp. EXF-3400]